MKWQPINTAPTNAVVLVCAGKYVEMAINSLVDGWNVVNADRAFSKVEPTHWMPLPGPYKEEEN